MTPFDSVPYRLATAIECTSQLVCAQLQEVRARSEGALRSRDQELCMSYAMVLVRSVLCKKHCRYTYQLILLFLHYQMPHFGVEIHIFDLQFSIKPYKSVKKNTLVNQPIAF